MKLAAKLGFALWRGCGYLLFTYGWWTLAIEHEAIGAALMLGGCCVWFLGGVLMEAWEES